MRSSIKFGQRVWHRPLIGGILYLSDYLTNFNEICVHYRSFPYSLKMGKLVPQLFKAPDTGNVFLNACG